MSINDFTIEQLESGNYVVKAEGLYQDIDFINGGYIATEQRAIEIRDLLIEQSNAPVVPVATTEQKVAELESQNAQIILALVTGGLM